MASLQLFMLRMHLLDSSSPYRTVAARRRRFSSSASVSTYNIADLNNNCSLSPIVNPALKRHRVPSFVYQTCPALEGGNESETPSQLAVHVFQGVDVKLRSEQPVSVSIEKFLSLRRSASPAAGYDEETPVISGVYLTPRMVPVSCVSTAIPCYNADTGTSTTLLYRTTVQFRRRYRTVAYQTINEEQQEVDREPPNYVSHACWIVSDFCK